MLRSSCMNGIAFFPKPANALTPFFLLVESADDRISSYIFSSFVVLLRLKTKPHYCIDFYCIWIFTKTVYFCYSNVVLQYKEIPTILYNAEDYLTNYSILLSTLNVSYRLLSCKGTQGRFRIDGTREKLLCFPVRLRYNMVS